MHPGCREDGSAIFRRACSPSDPRTTPAAPPPTGSPRDERTISASVIYVALGALGAVALWLLGLAPLDPVGDHMLLERLTELALIVAVFSAGLTIERNVPRRSRSRSRCCWSS